MDGMDVQVVPTVKPVVEIFVVHQARIAVEVLVVLKPAVEIHVKIQVLRVVEIDFVILDSFVVEVHAVMRAAAVMCVAIMERTVKTKYVFARNPFVTRILVVLSATRVAKVRLVEIVAVMLTFAKGMYVY